MIEVYDPDLGKTIVFDGEATPVITTVCCECGDILGIKDGEGITGLSHTYCNVCAATLLTDILF